MSEPGLNELAEGMKGLDIPLSYSNRVLSQFAGCFADPYTINFVRLVCRTYTVASGAERVFNSALNNLPCFQPNEAESRLQFGWAEEFLLRNRGVHIFGYEHLVLSSAMVDGGLNEAYAAAVLSALGDHFEDLRGDGREGGMLIRPHMQAFRGLIHSVNGILVSTDLAQVVDDRVRQNPYRCESGHGMGGEPSRFIPPREFAAAVNAVGQLAGAVGGKKEVLIVGGDVLGWFAGTAEWLLDLSVRIEDAEGKVLYEFKGGREGLVRLVFVPSIGAEATKLPQQFPGCLTLIGTTYEPTPISGSIIPFTGRVTWEALLPKVFGKYFTQLAHHESRTTASALGGIARAFDIFAKDHTTSLELLSAQNRANEAALGMGFITTLGNWFPELRHMQGRMERVQKQNWEECQKTCDEAAIYLESLCKCDICTKGSTRQLGKNEFCLVTIMETIATLTLAMSRITVVSKLYPSRAGILCMYHNHAAKRREIQHIDENDTDRSRHVILFGKEWNAGYARRLRNAVAIFAGSWPQKDLPDNLVAVSHEGVCAYMLLLNETDPDGTNTPSAQSDTIRVTSGNVAWKQNTYARACLGPISPTPSLEDGWDELKCAHLGKSLFVK